MQMMVDWMQKCLNKQRYSICCMLVLPVNQLTVRHEMNQVTLECPT